MSKQNIIPLSLEFSTICTNYNTSYLDRDNDDPGTMQCMRKVLRFTEDLLEKFLNEFDFKIFMANTQTPVSIADVVTKRFLFYSLEKEITLQNYSLQKKYFSYNNIDQWLEQNEDGLLLQNDEDGQCLIIYVVENSEVHNWFKSNYNL